MAGEWHLCWTLHRTLLGAVFHPVLTFMCSYYWCSSYIPYPAPSIISIACLHLHSRKVEQTLPTQVQSRWGCQVCWPMLCEIHGNMARWTSWLDKQWALKRFFWYLLAPLVWTCFDKFGSAAAARPYFFFWETWTKCPSQKAGLLVGLSRKLSGPWT